MNRELTSFIQSFVEEYKTANHLEDFWRTPQVGFADAQDLFIQRLPEIIQKNHHRPEDFLPGAGIIVVYFIPFSESISVSNRSGENGAASREWAKGVDHTDVLLDVLGRAVARFLSERGFRSAVPDDASMLKEILSSNWSHRHIAYAAGLGTFGINNMLITDSGCCGRFGTVVTDAPLTAGTHLTEERCLYKSRGICAKCIKNCPSGALSEEGFDRIICYDTCKENGKRLGVECCGKCMTDIPCEFAVPGIR